MKTLKEVADLLKGIGQEYDIVYDQDKETFDEVMNAIRNFSQTLN